MPRNDDVQTNNNHIFKAFRLNFEQGKPEAFLDSANQLVNWLSDQRAYYDSARRSIIELLEVAQAAIRRIDGRHIPDREFHVSKLYGVVGVHALAIAYAQMITTVMGHRKEFREDELRVRLDALNQTVVMTQGTVAISTPSGSSSRPQNTGPPQVVHQSSTLQTAQGHWVNGGPAAAPVPHSTRVAPPAPYFQHNTILSAARPPMATAAKGSASRNVSALPNIRSQQPGPTLATSSSVPPPITTASGPSPFVIHQATPASNTPTSTSASPPQPHTTPATMERKKPKPKARKSFNMDFLDGDLEWFAEQQNTQTNAPIPEPTVQESGATTEVTIPQLAEVTPRPATQTITTFTSVAEQNVAAEASPVAPEQRPATDTVSTSTSAEPDLQAAAADRELQEDAPVELSLPEPRLPTPIDDHAGSASGGDFIREDSPDIPLMLQHPSPVDKRKSSPVNIVPNIATLPEPSETTDTPDVDELASGLVSRQSPPLLTHNVPSASPSKTTPPKKKRGRPPGIRTLPIPSEDPADKPELAPLPSEADRAQGTTSPTTRPSTSPSRHVSDMATTGTASRKVPLKKRGRPPGIRDSDMPRPDAVNGVPSTQSSSSLKIRIPPRSPEVSLKPLTGSTAGPSNKEALKESIRHATTSHSQAVATAQVASTGEAEVINPQIPRSAGSTRSQDAVRVSEGGPVEASKVVRPRKRKSSRAGDLDESPPRQRKRTESLVSAKSVPPTTASNLSTTAVVASTSSGLPSKSVMDVDHGVPIPRQSSRVAHGLRASESKEEGELTPTPSMLRLRSPPESGEHVVVPLGRRREHSWGSVESGEIAPSPSPKAQQPKSDENTQPQAGPSQDGAGLKSPLEATVPHHPLPEALTTIHHSQDPVYGDSLQILCILWSTATDTTSFTLSEELLNQVGRWANRLNTKQDWTDTRCLSLATYRVEDMLEIHKRCGDISEEELLKIRPTSWPSPSIALLLNSQDGEDEISIKPNHLPYVSSKETHVVDLIPYPDKLATFKKGENTLKITPHAASTQHVCVIASHAPSPEQLRNLKEYWDAEDSWAAYKIRLRTFKPLLVADALPHVTTDPPSSLADLSASMTELLSSIHPL